MLALSSPVSAEIKDAGEKEAEEGEAKDIVREAIDYWRDNSSRVTATMEIKRKTWSRKSELESVTKGNDRSLVRFTAPAKDAGSASLTRGDEMWTYSPKTNRVIKIPSSMKGQSWMGSDLSYKDLSRADDIVDNYTHKVIGKAEDDHGLTVKIIESIPLEDAPIVWGREVLHIRSDNIILNHEFYDQDGVLVKRFRASDVKEMGGKIYPGTMRMERVDRPGEWTELVHKEVQFDVDVPDSRFTLSNLRNRRR
ncbi:hypothetical protein BVY02_02035 [bacterium J17]|nr:hypothetical protein BVY02_02035 [bacterium J17]